MYIHRYVFTSKHTHVHTYLRTYLPTYLPVYGILTYLHISMPTYLRLYIPRHPDTDIPTYIHTHTHIQPYKRTSMRTYKHTNGHIDKQTNRHTDVHTYIHTYMHACMHACMHTYIDTCTRTYVLLYIDQKIGVMFQSKKDCGSLVASSPVGNRSFGMTLESTERNSQKALSTHRISPQTLNIWQIAAIILRWSCSLGWSAGSKAFFTKSRLCTSCLHWSSTPAWNLDFVERPYADDQQTKPLPDVWLEKVTRHDKPLCIAMQWFLLALIVPNWITSCENLEDGECRSKRCRVWGLTVDYSW